MSILQTDYDPYAALLQLQHDVEQLQYYQNQQAQIINHQSHVIEQLSQNFLIMVKHVEHLEQKIEELE